MVAILFLILWQTNLNNSQIYDYHVFTGISQPTAKHGMLVLLRKFNSDGESKFLAVNPDSLITCIVDAKGLPADTATWEIIRKKFAGKPYFRAIDEAETNSSRIQDSGITKVRNLHNGIDLSVDLCPSHLPLDTIVFTKLFNELGTNFLPVPVAISVSGKWIENHVADLRWLTTLEKKGKLAITWINHSYNHRFSRKLPLNRNFLLEPGTNIQSEVLQTEMAMLQHDLLPSVFFRFPGLVSDKKLFNTIVSYGLIPVGSDAWLAKGQQPQNGSIVLIHANGNEPIGVHDFIKLLQNHSGEIFQHKWVLYDLRESIMENEND